MWPTVSGGAVFCQCGALLLKPRQLDETTMVIGTARVPFQRSTDHVLCRSCHLSYRVHDVRAAVDTAETDRQR